MTKKNATVDKKTGKTLEQFEKALLMLSKVDINLVDTAILESEFSCQQEEKSLVGYATFTRVQARTKEAKQLNSMLKSAGIGYDTRKQALKALLPMPSKPKEEKTSVNLNLKNTACFWDLISKWHLAVHKKPVPKTWGFDMVEREIKTGTDAVLFFLYHAVNGNMDARKLFTNQTDLNMAVRKQIESKTYSNQNSAKAFGSFFKYVEELQGN